MKDYFNKAKGFFSKTTDALSREIENGFKFVKEKVGDLPVFISLERLDSTPKEFDEKHYFVIPDFQSETQFSLHTTRSLPFGVPEINDLPKRRVFHFPSEHYEAALKAFMAQSARELSKDKLEANKSSIESLADEIDALDSKLTYGMLVVGGIAAIFNPLVGAGIAVKAITPSITGLLNKYGIRPIGEKLSQSQLEKEAKKAEENVLKQFSESETLKVINPILQELDFALRTTVDQHDPLHDPNLADGSIPELNNENWRELTEKAIFHVYKDVVKDKKQHAKANLGPEDIRWLKVMFADKE